MAFFGAIAHIIYKLQENHNIVRTKIVYYIHIHSVQLGEILIGNDTTEQHRENEGFRGNGLHR